MSGRESNEEEIDRSRRAEDSDDASDDSEEEEEATDLQFDPNAHIEISKGGEVEVAPRFGLSGSCFRLKFKDQSSIRDAELVARFGFKKVLSQAFRQCGPQDLVGVAIDHPDLDHDILVRFGRKETITADAVMERIASVQQSKRDLNFDSTMQVKVTKISVPQGRGFPKLANGRFEDVFKKCSSGHGSTIVEIKNKDWMCLARAIVVARARYRFFNMGDNSVNWEAIRKGDSSRCTRQKEEALELMTKAGLSDYKERSCGVPEMGKLQKVLLEEGFQLKVFSHNCFNALIFDQRRVGARPLYILHHNDHYSPILSPRIITGTNHYCDLCDRGYDIKGGHTCEYKCPHCRQNFICHSERWIRCDECGRDFPSRECFDRHKERPEIIARKPDPRQPYSRKRVISLGSSVCMWLKGCLECRRSVPLSCLLPEKHHCGLRFCRICKTHVKMRETHFCYIQPTRDRKKRKNRKRESEVRVLSDESSDNEDEEDDVDRLLREEEQAQGETAVSRDQHFREHDKIANAKGGKYLFYDFETLQEDQIGERKINQNRTEYSLGPIYRHRPNYCVARKACLQCKDFWLTRCSNKECKFHDCQECEKNRPKSCFCGNDYRKTFKGENCLDEFCDWLFRENHRGTVCIAHNSAGFDSMFLVKWLITKARRIPKITFKGMKLLTMEVIGMKFIDSLCFLNQRLANLPKTFNEPELKKGYFPYLFNLRENWNYVGPFPPRETYCPSEMKPPDRKKFEEWYADQKDGVFDFQKEIKEYTESDVDILLRCCLRFNDLFHEVTGIYPLDSAITIAQACNQVFRRHFLKENTIGIIPSGGYQWKERQSAEAMKWIKWMSQSRNVYIQHARNGREKRIGKYKADGYIESTNTVLEYNGCAVHGCPRCYRKRDGKTPYSSLTFEEAYLRTREKADFIRSKGYELISIWSCEWEAEKQSNSEIQKFLNSLPEDHFLDLRNALTGGRTNATWLYKKCSKKGTRIDYLDVCSLYPYVCKYAVFPIRHPEILTENFQEIEAGANPYFGIIKCRVLPPRKLLHPVLGYKYNGRLNFVLCRSCLEEGNERECTHDDDERALTSEWVSVELDKALSLGYKVLDVYAVANYKDRMQYDRVNEDTGLFSGYINTFLKLKQESSDWPSWVKTRDDRQKYIREYERKEGIKLDPAKIERNNGLRALAKLCLNSFWGKFAQEENMGRTEFFSEPNAFFDVVCNRENDISCVRAIGSEMVCVQYKKTREYVEPNPATNVVLAAFVTAHARLRLFQELERLQNRVLYFDTDSIIFYTDPSDPTHSYVPPTGDYLGDLTNELDEFGEGALIQEFVSCGPKQYSFVVRNPAGEKLGNVTKVKGFNLNYTSSAHINFKTMKRQVRKYAKGTLDEVVLYRPQIRRMKDFSVTTEVERKVQKVVYCKRKVNRFDFSTLPFGY